MLNFLRQLAGYPPAERNEKVERRYRIPDEYVPEVLELSDKARMQGGADRYRLWKRLEEIYPAVKRGSWALDSSHPANIYLVSERKK